MIRPGNAFYCVFSQAIYLIVALSGSTFDRDSHMHSFLLLYYLAVPYCCLLYFLAVCLIVILPGIPFSFELPRSTLECNTLGSNFDCDTRWQSLVSKSKLLPCNGTSKNQFGQRTPGPKWFWAEMTRNWCSSAVRLKLSYQTMRQSVRPEVQCTVALQNYVTIHTQLVNTDLPRRQIGNESCHEKICVLNLQIQRRRSSAQ